MRTETAGELRAAAWRELSAGASTGLFSSWSNNRKPQIEVPLSLRDGPHVPSGLALSHVGVKVESGSPMHSRSE